MLVIEKARANGIEARRLLEMVRLSARCTHARGNRRYEGTVFAVQNGEVLDLQPFDMAVEFVDPYSCETCKGIRFVPVLDECARCEGRGCQHCDAGLVPARIPCPTCR